MSMAWRSPVAPYVSVIRRRWWARRGRALIWAVRYGEQFVGQVSVWSITWGANRSAQVGYWVDERFAGRGITPTALALAVDFCFQVAGLHRLEASIQPGNGASRRVMEKLGFREEGLRVREVHIDGAWRDHISYAITAEEVPYGMLPRWRDSLAASRSGTPASADLQILNWPDFAERNQAPSFGDVGHPNRPLPVRWPTAPLDLGPGAIAPLGLGPGGTAPLDLGIGATAPLDLGPGPAAPQAGRHVGPRR
jgi:ribosomal-protein-alanine N-acetyltransferase